jgi:hypothetical protein
MISKSKEGIVPHTVARLSESLCVVVEGLQDVLFRFDPQVSKLLSDQISNISLGSKDPLGLGALAALTVFSSQYITNVHTDNVVRGRFHQLMKVLMTLYIFENVTDDLCVIEISESGTHYTYAGVMRAFYLLMEQLIEGRISLADALAQASALPTDHIRLPFIDRLLKAYPLPQEINGFFMLHLMTAADVLTQLRAFEGVFGGLMPLIQKARMGFVERYRTSRLCIEIPDVPADVALERGKATIFTDFHCPYVLLSAASVDAGIRRDLTAHLDAVLMSIDHSSYLHRIFNEAGISGIRPDVTLRIFSEAADVPGMTPRHYIKHLARTATPETHRQIARLIKDAEEEEANMVLDSLHMDTPQPAALIRDNLLFLNRQLNTSLSTLKDLLPRIEHPYIAAMLSNFLEFQRSIYSLMVGEGGEYVGARETLLLNGLEAILNAEYPTVFIDRLLAQSKLSEAGV